MTTWRLLDGAAGRPGTGSSGTRPPSAPDAYTGPFEAAQYFAVTQGGLWLEGYWWWVPPGGDTGPQKFCLYSLYNSSPVTGQLITAATVTSGTLTAGTFNWIPLASPVQLSIGTLSASANGSGLYCVQTGWTALNGFPVSTGQLGTAEPYQDGYVNGPLAAWGAANTPGFSPAVSSCFGTGSADPATGIVTGVSGSGDLFWLDLQVTDETPAGYPGSYRLYPNRADWNGVSTADSAASYVIAVEVHLSQACTLDDVRYYSPSGTSQLATRAGVYSILGADSGSEVAAIVSPSWSGAAGSGWVSAAAGTVLPAGQYKVYVFNGAATPDMWSAKDASSAYWDTGEGSAGITSGPLYAPPLSSASAAYEYDSSGGGNTPPFSGPSGATEAGQCTFAQTGPQYPYLYVDGLAQNYWLDVEVTPLGVPPAAARVSGGPLRPRLAEAHRFSR